MPICMSGWMPGCQHACLGDELDALAVGCFVQSSVHSADLASVPNRPVASGEQLIFVIS